MSHKCIECRKERHRNNRQMRPSGEYFTIETIIQTQSVNPKVKKSRRGDSSKSIRGVSQNHSQIQQSRQVGRLKAKLDSCERQLEALKRANQRLRQQMGKPDSSSLTKSPYQAIKHSMPFEKIQHQELSSNNLGKISLGSNKPASKDIDQLLIGSSRSKITPTSPSQMSSSSQSVEDHRDPTSKFADLMLKLQQPRNQTQQRKIREDALRVAGKIRSGRPSTQRLHEGLYY